MTPEDQQFTCAWWSDVVNDEERLIRWLQKLQATEFSGLEDNIAAAEKWTTPDSATDVIFRKTGDDEKRHSDLLIDVLIGRGGWPVESPPEESMYWAEMYKHINSMERCAAVFHFGELLASERFEILLNHEETPPDVLGFLKAALPDEQYHTRIFQKMAGNSALIEMASIHHFVVKRLKRT